jgi:hypothetical protein
MNPTHELLSKADVIREYKYPRRQLDADLKAGKIPYFTSTYEPPSGRYISPGRVYIPRHAIERRIDELTRGEETA